MLSLNIVKNCKDTSCIPRREMLGTSFSRVRNRKSNKTYPLNKLQKSNGVCPEFFLLLNCSRNCI